MVALLVLGGILVLGAIWWFTSRGVSNPDVAAPKVGPWDGSGSAGQDGSLINVGVPTRAEKLANPDTRLRTAPTGYSPPADPTHGEKVTGAAPLIVAASTGPTSESRKGRGHF